MKISSTITLAVAATSTSAAVVSRAGAACPAVWTTISTDLSTLFLQSNGQCNDDARAAVRLAFHDCATWATAQGKTGGCDGSIVLSAVENARPENDGLQPISGKLAALASQNKVGVADMVAYAGAHATVSCPLGPTVKTVVGRNDSSNPAPNEALLPANASMTADMIITLFADKGFSAPDVAALIGAHTSARQDFVDPALAGEPEDRTPGIWDVSYYNDTFNQPPGVFVFQSDISVSQDSRSGPTFKSFIGQQAYVSLSLASPPPLLISPLTLHPQPMEPSLRRHIRAPHGPRRRHLVVQHHRLHLHPPRAPRHFCRRESARRRTYQLSWRGRGRVP